VTTADQIQTNGEWNRRERVELLTLFSAPSNNELLKILQSTNIFPFQIENVGLLNKSSITTLIIIKEDQKSPCAACSSCITNPEKIIQPSIKKCLDWWWSLFWAIVYFSQVILYMNYDRFLACN
jgi:hypothetical protein